VGLVTPTTAQIVLVDDDDHVREVAEMVLSSAGHTVRATGNGFEALRWMEAEPCDLLIADLKMPEIDGPTLYAEVQARWPSGGPRVMFLSGFADAAAYGPAVSCPASILLKPFSVEDLRAAVVRALASV
jgi:DNA-binding NtrC family response regulator